MAIAARPTAGCSGGALPLIPASNMKLVTVATALELLGPEAACPAGARGSESLAELAAQILATFACGMPSCRGHFLAT